MRNSPWGHYFVFPQEERDEFFEQISQPISSLALERSCNETSISAGQLAGLDRLFCGVFLEGATISFPRENILY
jgi:hypothetical protein